MTSFLTASACRGRRPKVTLGDSYCSRSDLLTQMIRHRQYVRFLIAPVLFGKTSLAAEYAESVFSFEQVYWLNGRSPCFLRDLDKGIIATTLLSLNSKPALVVIDDMPYLDKEREIIAADTLEAFISRGWEVIVTMLPGHESLASMTTPSFCFNASDLLLSHSEIDACRSKVEINRRSATLFSREECIPGLFWSDRVDHDAMIRSIVQHGFSHKTLLTLFVMLVLKQGDYDDLALFVGNQVEDDCKVLADYLYLGIVTQDASFTTHTFSLDVIAKIFLPRLSVLAETSLCAEQDTLVIDLADFLIKRKDGARACTLIRKMASPPKRAFWLTQRAENLFSQACIMPAHLLHESIHAGKRSQGGLLLALEAWRLILLGEKKRPLRSAMRLYRSSSSDISTRMLSCLLVLRYGSNEVSVQARAACAEIAELPVLISKKSNIPFPEGDALKSNIELFAKVLIEGEKHRRRGLAETLNFLQSCADDAPVKSAMSVLLAWMMEDFRAEHASATAVHETNEVTSHDQNLVASTTFALEHIKGRAESGNVNFFDAMLAKQLDCVADGLEGDRQEALSFLDTLSASIDPSYYEKTLLSQRKAYQEVERFRMVKRGAYQRVYANTLKTGGTQIEEGREDYPYLRIHLFGGLEVFIGGQSVDPKLFSRQKVKLLLALLVLQQGRELSRERLCYLLWPERDEMSAQRNLYSIWSFLKRALSLSSGLCPYLVRTQFSYKMDMNFVSSDVSDLLKLCRTLQFEEIPRSEWPSVFIQLNDCYAGDLLPTEMKNVVITRMRKDLKSRLVDALATAASKRYEAKDFQTALLLARTVLSRDASREDIYTLLMQIQIALGQRTAALDTFFRCRQYLSEQLGIDPSAKTHSLYLRIIKEEPVFDPYDPSLYEAH